MRVRRCAQGLEHRRQGLVFKTAPGTPWSGEARAVEHQPQGKSGQSLRFSLEWPRSALGWAAADALEEGVGQVVDVASPWSAARTDPSPDRTAAPRCRAAASETLRGASCSCGSKSTPRSSPSAERSHSQRQSGRGSEPIAPPCGRLAMATRARVPLKSLAPAKPPGRSCAPWPTARMLDADRTRAISSSEPTVSGRPVPPDGALLSSCAAMRWTRAARFPPQDSGTSSACGRAAARRARTARPVTAFDREVAPQVEQGALTDLLAAALRAHKAMRIIDLAVLAGSGPGAPNIGHSIGAGARAWNHTTKILLALHCAPENLYPAISMTCAECRSISSESCAPPLTWVNVRQIQNP